MRWKKATHDPEVDLEQHAWYLRDEKNLIWIECYSHYMNDNVLIFLVKTEIIGEKIRF